ncbi:MAG: endoglucanase [Planctomycetes bacterium GWF2_41_51]|nr:MAG: endoglucanase [Planctomycetes bacterium GWF2_41_51]
MSSLNCFGKSVDPFAQNKRLGRGINFGNALEAPKEGEWGVTLKQEYFEIIKKAGFDSVRIPIRWSSHAMEQSPYTIDPNFFKRVDWAVKNALHNNLYVMINMHHYMELMEEPNAHSERFLALWKQVAEHYKDYPNSVLFEPLNEPHNALTSELWNPLLEKAIAVIRESNPQRTIVVNPAHYASDIDRLVLPESDRNTIVSFHYYMPMEFTHQGAEWTPETKDLSGITWKATEEEKQAVDNHFNKAEDWSKKYNRPINVGEFGAYYKAGAYDRIRWTGYVANSAIRRGFSFHYWEFCSGFGVYDPQRNEWKSNLLNAIVPQKK